MKKIIKFLFGEIDKNHITDIMLCLLFFVTLFSTTCFFFDSHKMSILGYVIYFPVGLLFFPATYVISNIIQDRSGRAYANTVVASAFLSDAILVGIGFITSHAGDRMDYLTVFNNLPLIMGSTFIFLSISSLLNTFVFELTKKLRKKSIFGMFVGFFSSIMSAELLVTFMSMPLLFYKQNLKTGLILTVLITVIYKLLFNLIATICYVIYNDSCSRKKYDDKNQLSC